MTGARVYVFATDPEHIRLQIEPQAGGMVYADLTAAEARWLADELSARLAPISTPREV